MDDWLIAHMIKIIFGDSFVVCCCVLTQTGEDNGDHTDHGWHSQPSVTEEKSWRGCDVLTHWQDTLPGVWWSCFLVYNIHGILRFVACDVFHCERWHLHMWTSLAHSDERWKMSQKWVDFAPTASKDSVQRKFCKFMRHLLIFSDSLWLLWCSFTSRVLLVMYPFLSQH